MSDTIVHGRAETRPAQEAPMVERNQAISISAPFPLVRGILSQYPPPRRPNRNHPLFEVDRELREEMNAWEAASDEALEGFENSLPE